VPEISVTPVVFTMKTLVLQESQNGHRVELQIPCAKDLNVVGVSPNLTAGRVWPASIVLALFLAHHSRRLQGKWIFEFGAGIAVPSMVALKSGAASGVYLQDLDSPALHSMQKYVFEVNNLKDTFVSCPLLWGSQPDYTDIFEKHGPVGLFIAADCLYSRDDFVYFSKTVAHFLRGTLGVSLVTVYQDRNHLYCLDEVFDQFGLKYKELSLAAFGVTRSSIESSLIMEVVDDFPVDELETALVALEITLADNNYMF